MQRRQVGKVHALLRPVKQYGRSLANRRSGFRRKVNIINFGLDGGGGAGLRRPCLFK